MVARHNKQGFRGRWLEDRIEDTNRMYAHRNIAIINKIPTPTQVIRRNGMIVGARYEKKSTVDFTGILDDGGRFIAFDTKECQKTSFSFSSVLSHQVQFLKKIKDLNGEAFILIYFRTMNELYKIDIDEYLDLMNKMSRKSIPYLYFKETKQPIVMHKYGYFFDYLGAGRKNMEVIQ